MKADSELCRYGFNSGSALSVSSGHAQALVARAAVNTTLAAGTGGLLCTILQRFSKREYNIFDMCNGILAGLVAITAGCAAVEPWAAVAVGALGAAVFVGLERVVLRLRVDDPLSASALHGGVGAFGALMVAVFARGEHLLQQLDKGESDFARKRDARGLVYGGNGRLLACQAIGACQELQQLVAPCAAVAAWLVAGCV